MLWDVRSYEDVVRGLTQIRVLMKGKQNRRGIKLENDNVSCLKPWLVKGGSGTNPIAFVIDAGECANFFIFLWAVLDDEL